MTARAAATVTVLRDGPTSLETLMLLRPVEAEFAPRAQVFPGGRVDDTDADETWRELVEFANPAEEHLALGEPEPGLASPLAYAVGAIREVFEETSVLLGVEAAEFPGEDWAEAERSRLAASEVSFADIIRDAGLQLRPGPMVYFAHWITPEGLPRRYDTRFFAARMPEEQHAVAAPGEIQSLEWIAPSDALARADTNDAYTLPPTRAVLTMLAPHRTFDAAVDGLTRDRDLTPILPKIVSLPSSDDGGMGGIQVLMPGDPGYE